MKNKNSLISLIIVFSVFMIFGCKKTAIKAKTATTTPITQVLYSMDDTLANTSTTVWSIRADGTNNKKLPISVPANLFFDSDIAAEVSTDNKTLALSLQDSLSTAYLYKCNVDGSNVQPIPNIQGYIYLQTFINSSSILYWENGQTGAENAHNGGLWQTNIDGSGNKQINISLPTGVYFGDGKFAKITADGKTIIFSTYGNAGDGPAIYKCNLDGSGLTLITSQNVTTLESIVYTNMLLYDVYDAISNTYQLWVVNTDGTNNHQVPLNLSAGLFLADSRAEASSNNIFFVTQDANGLQAIYAADIDGSDVKLVLNVPSGYAVKLQGLIN